jgi:TRAP-type transport system periplasmic protein
MKGKVAFVLLASIGIAAFLFGMTQHVQAAEKVIGLSYSTQFPPGYHVAKATALWAQDIEKRSKGRVKITIYYSGTLTSAPACYEGVVRGLSDMGEALPAMTRGRFPLMEVVDLPGYPFNAVVTSRVADDFYRKFKPKEFDETHVLYIHAHAPGGMFFRTKPVKSLEDLKGLRIRCTGVSTKIVQALGGTPVAMPKSDQYDAMSRGTVDGTMAPPNELLGWKVADVAKYFDVYPKAGYVTAFAVVMNKAKWNSLPPDIRNIFTETSAAMPEKMGKVWNDGEIEGIQYGKKVGHKFIFITPEEGARWEKALKPLLDDYVKSMKAKSLPGEEALKYRTEIIEKYGKMYPPLKFE